MTGSTTAAAAAFTNVPRRRRSAAVAALVARLREAEEEGIHPGRDNGAAVAPEPPLSRSDAAEPVNKAAGKQGGGGALGFDAASPVPSRKDEPVVPLEISKEAPSSSRTPAAPPLDHAKKERLRKGKMWVVAESPPKTSACDAAAGKLMGDAMRAHANTTAALKRSSGTKNKKRKDRGPVFWFGMGSDGKSTSSAGCDMDLSFHRIAVVSNRLRAALGHLGAAAPVRVYGKMMKACDRMTHHCRLLMSCKSWPISGGPFPLEGFLKEDEKKAAHGKGLVVSAYDRGGDRYGGMKCRYLVSNSGYRLIADWNKFLRRNGLVVKRGQGRPAEPKDVMIDLWMFRSPGGQVGLVMLHYRKGDAAHADAAFEEEEMEKRVTRRRKGNATTKASAPEHGVAMQDGGNDAVMEDAVGDAKEKVEDAGVKGELAAAPLLSEADGAKAAAGTSAQMETGAQSSDADGVKTAGDEAGVHGKMAAPSSSDAGGARAADEDAGAQAAAAALSYKYTKYEMLAARALLMLSKVDD